MTVHSKVWIADRIATEYARLQSVLDQLSDEQMLQQGAEGQWSVKDIVAHIAAWESRLTQQITASVNGDASALPEPIAGAADMDRLNAAFYAAQQHLSLGTLLQHAHSVHDQMLAALQLLSDDDLTDPQRFGWTNGTPMTAIVAGDTYEHYEEHMQSIEALIRN